MLSMLPFLIHEPLYKTVRQRNSIWQKYEVIDNDNQFSVHLDVPGVKATDLNVTVNDEHISVTRSSNKEEQISLQTSFEKVFTVDPETTDLSNVKAELTDGVLIISAPKKPKPAPLPIQVMTDQTSLEESEKAVSDSTSFAVMVDVPGIQITDLNVTFNNDNLLEINGTRGLHLRDGIPTKKSRYSKSIHINKDEVEVTHLKGTLTDGVLTVFAPLKPKPEPKQIVISSETSTFCDSSNMFLISLDVPGVKYSDLSLNINDESVLYVKWSRLLHGSLKPTNFVKVFHIDAETVELSEITANLSNGVLIVSAPKKTKPEPRAVQITTSTNTKEPEAVAETMAVDTEKAEIKGNAQD